MNLESTRIYCPTCGTFHPADYAESDGAAFWRLHCPKGDRDLPLSSDARLFRRFRAQARPLPAWYRRSFTNCLVHINDDCSLQCPVCFENAPRSGWRMSLDELRRTAHRLRDEAPFCTFVPCLALISTSLPPKAAGTVTNSPQVATM